MSISIATRGIIGGFNGGYSSGDIVYIDFPMCNEGPESEKIGSLSFTAKDPNVVLAIPNPTSGIDVLPRRKSTTLILPSKNIYKAFPTPND